MNWASKAKMVGLRVGLDRDDLTHVLNEVMGDQSNCGVELLRLDQSSGKICVHCRELPGREAHYQKVMVSS